MIEVLTILTKYNMSKYSRYNLFRNKFLLIFAPLFLITVSVLFIAFDHGNIVLPIVGCCLAVVVPLVVVAGNEISNGVLYKKTYTQQEVPYIKYLFNQNNFEFENNFGDLTTTNIISYDLIVSCIEIKDFFYLYINRTYAYIVDKTGFKQGSAAELSSLLKFKCLKYKKKYK